jgi:phage N-6-adenine-methyltransferase
MKIKTTKQNHQLINADNGSDEYYTPAKIVEAARRVLGGFDLDPASSHVANRRVKAKNFFTASDCGLTHKWGGRVWMNHPFGKTTNRPWIAKLAAEYAAGRVTEAICITFASTSEKWFAPLLAQPQCYFTGRTNYHLPNGEIKRGATKGSVVTYFGKNVEKFAREFSKLGTVKVVYAP